MGHTRRNAIMIASMTRPPRAPATLPTMAPVLIPLLAVMPVGPAVEVVVLDDKGLGIPRDG